MNPYYAYSDSESQEGIVAESLDDAAQKFGIPTEDEINDGGFLVVRDEETYEEKTWGKAER